MNRSISIMGLFLIFSCGNGVELGQEIKVASTLRGTKYVTTEVWVTDWRGYPISLEYWTVISCNALEVDSICKAEKLKATKYYNACLNCK